MSYNITIDEFELFSKLCALYHSVSLSTLNPVVVPSGESSSIHSPIAHIYYDCADHGEIIMAYRIDQAADDIRLHFATHKSLIKSLDGIQKAINKNDRSSVINNLKITTKILRAYEPQVTQHQQRHEHNAFLLHPFIIPGHFYMIPHSNQNISILEFNPEVSGEGLIDELNNLERLCIPFSMEKSNIKGIEIKPGTTDISQDFRIYFEMLKTLGFNPENPQLLDMSK